MTELSSGFNSIGFGAFNQVKTTESQNSLGVHLFCIWKQTVGCSKSFKVIQNVCLLHGYDKCGDRLVTLVPKKRKPSNRKAQYGTSYPTHLTRLEDKMKTLPYPPYIGMALKLCTCRLFTRTTCSLLLPGLELNMTFPFRPYKVCPFHSDMKTSLQLRSMGWPSLSYAGRSNPLLQLPFGLQAGCFFPELTMTRRRRGKPHRPISTCPGPPCHGGKVWISHPQCLQHWHPKFQSLGPARTSDSQAYDCHEVLTVFIPGAGQVHGRNRQNVLTVYWLYFSAVALPPNWCLLHKTMAATIESE